MWQMLGKGEPFCTCPLLEQLQKSPSWIKLISNDVKRIHSIDLVKTFAYGTSKDLIREKQEIKCDNINKILEKTINSDDITKEKK